MLNLPWSSRVSASISITSLHWIFMVRSQSTWATEDQWHTSPTISVFKCSAVLEKEGSVCVVCICKQCGFEEEALITKVRFSRNKSKVCIQCLINYIWCVWFINDSDVTHTALQIYWRSISISCSVPWLS